MSPSIPLSRAAGWFVAALAVGWLIVYNVLRLTGGAPAEVALVAAVVGGLIGLVAFVVLMLVIRHHLAHGGQLDHGPPPVPSAAEIPGHTRDLMSATAWVLAALAALAVGMGVFLAASWYQDAPDRAQTTIILAAWNLLIGVWLADEYVHLRRFEGEGLDSVALGCLVTAVLAAVGLSREMAEVGQIGLIVLGGMGAVLCHLVLWRFTRRAVPWSALIAGAVAALALVLPLIS